MSKYLSCLSLYIVYVLYVASSVYLDETCSVSSGSSLFTYLGVTSASMHGYLVSLCIKFLSQLSFDPKFASGKCKRS